MKDYSNMSDFEINRRVVEALGYETGWKAAECAAIGIADGSAFGRYVNYCNNPSDAWPVIQDNKINMAWDDIRQTWVAYSVGARHNATSTNPLRAAMEVFLSMEDTRRGV